MNLWELPSIATHRPPNAVPRWTLGCFRRRSITFFDGSSDATTEVIWLQTYGLTADFRLPPARPQLLTRDELFACDKDVLGTLLDVEGGVSRAHWDGTLMSWQDWVGFQTRVKWPEPGALRRVGDCLVEFAPSGAYVEDWRLEPSGEGPLVALELLEERDAQDGTLRHQGGALILCGQHAAFVRGRPPQQAAALAAAQLQPQAQEQEPRRSTLEAWLACEASYAVVDAAAGALTIVASTSPWREGENLLELEGFEYDGQRGLVMQRAVEDGCAIERRFAIDSLEPTFEPVLATPVTAEGRAWRDREHATLLRYAQAARPR
jgi:hypothetical protein